jgi:hypothetical protein
VITFISSNILFPLWFFKSLAHIYDSFMSDLEFLTNIQITNLIG